MGTGSNQFSRFLLATFHLDSLRDKTSPKAIMQALSILPRGADPTDMCHQTYTEVMQRLEPKDLALRVLSWVTCAYRTLSVGELQCALATDLITPKIDSDDITEKEDLISACAGLVVVDEASDKVRLAHYTVQVYLESTLHQWLPDAQCDIAAVCANIIAYFGTSMREHRDVQLTGFETSAPLFLAYACSYGGRHARKAPKTSDALISYLEACPFKDIVPKSMKAFSLRRQKAQPGLHVCAEYGLDNAIAILLQRGHNVNQRDPDGRTALSIAAARGYTNVVETLVKADGACMHIRDKKGHNALYYAVKNDYQEIAEILRKSGAIEDHLDNDSGFSALSDPPANGGEPAFGLLLRSGTFGLNSRERNEQTPLSLAATFGYEGNVKYLIETGQVDLDAKDRWGRTPLWIAAEAGHDRIVKLLVETGKVDVSSRDESGRTSLQVAAELKHESVVKILTATGKVEVDLKEEEEDADTGW